MSDIETVNSEKEAREMMKSSTKLRRRMTLILLLLAIICLGFLWYKMLGDESMRNSLLETPEDYFLLLSVPIMIIVLTVLFIRNSRKVLLDWNKEIMISFAKSSGLTLSKKVSKEESDCQLLNSGKDRRIFNYIEGNYENHPIEVYNYKHSFVHLNSVVRYEYVVFELKTKKSLPATIISAKKSYLAYALDKDINFISSDRLRTESNEFDKEFQIFFKKDDASGEGRQILEILTPNIIEKLIDEEKRHKDKDIHLEFSGNTILLYASTRFTLWSFRIVKEKKDLQRLLCLFFNIVRETENAY